MKKICLSCRLKLILRHIMMHGKKPNLERLLLYRVTPTKISSCFEEINKFRFVYPNLMFYPVFHNKTYLNHGLYSKLEYV